MKIFVFAIFIILTLFVGFYIGQRYTEKKSIQSISYSTNSYQAGRDINFYPPTNYIPQPKEINQAGWLPPELPDGCTNVTVSFGQQSSTYPVWMAEAQDDVSITNEIKYSGTNYAVQISSNLVVNFQHIDNTNLGTLFALKDLPDYVEEINEKDTNYSPRYRGVSIAMTSSSISLDYGNEIQNPILPCVISNRLFVDVVIPYTNQRRRIILDTNIDYAVDGIPQRWDINYNSNKFEIVNEETNPMLQVIYRAPNDVLVNGVYIYAKYDIYEAFNCTPSHFTQFASFLNDKGQPIGGMVNLEDVEKIIPNQKFPTLDTNAFLKKNRFVNQKAIFKYPSWKYLHVLAGN